MVLYEWRAELNKWKWVTWPRPIVKELSDRFRDGTAYQAWPIPELLLLDPENQVERGYADCLQHYSTEVKIITHSACSALREVLGDAVNILDMKCAFGAYCAINVLVCEDCLDQGRSQIRYLPSGSIGEIRHYCFNPMQYNTNVFRIKGLGGTVFVTEKFLEAVTSAKLTGFRFLKVPSA